MKKYVVIREFYLGDSMVICDTFNNVQDAILYRDIMQRNLHESKYHKTDSGLAPNYTYEVYEQILRK